MSQPFDTLALYDSLTPDERAELDRAMEANPALAEAFSRWTSLRAAVRRELAADLPDRTLLVLYALADDDVLDADERARLDAARDDLGVAMERHPGLVDAVCRIRADREAFEHAWAVHTQMNGEGKAKKSSADRPPLRLVRPQRPARWVWRIAALVAIVLGGALLVQIVMRDAGFETIRASELMAVDLPDGSSVELAEGAVLMIPEEGNSFRQARLMGGRALFYIRRDEANPFTIETPNATVTVLGTTFGVAVTAIETEVVLASGIVELASHADPEVTVRLEPGERSRVLSLDLPTEPTSADINAELSWTGDLFIRAESMASVAEQLSRVFDMEVEVDATLAGELVSSTSFEREAGLEAALQELALSLGAQVLQLEGGGFRIAP